MLIADITLHLVTGPRAGGWAGVREAVLAAAAAGVRLVQLRDKAASARDLVEMTRELIAIARKRRALVLVNDRLDVALAAGADGAHLGEDDLPWVDARRLAPPPFVLGFSAATEEACRAALAAGADYVGAGPAFPTDSKADAGAALPVARFGELRRLCRSGERAVPLVAIGGVAPGRAAPLVEAGADAVAVINAIMGASDPGAAARQLLQEVAAARGAREGR